MALQIKSSAVTCAPINHLYQFAGSRELTDEAFDTERLDLHVNQQAAVGLHQRRGEGDAGLGMGQLYDPCGDTVDQTSTRRKVCTHGYAKMTQYQENTYVNI